MTTSTGESLTAALVAAYRPWLAYRLAALGTEAPPGWEPVIDRGAGWLEAELGQLLGLPFTEQRRSPLEVFQEAMRFPTEALAAAGQPAAARDPGQEAALPGDRYDLAPASSQVLGEDVWHAHLAWGAAKAKAMAPARPRSVGYVGGNLMDRTAIENAAAAKGLGLAVAGSAEAAAALLAERPLAVFVDLTLPDADDVIRAAAAAGVRVIAFGPHVDDVALVRARSLGADEALPRSRFFRTLSDWLPDLV